MAGRPSCRGSLPSFELDRQELYLGSGRGWIGAKTVGTGANLSYGAIPSWAKARRLDFVPIWSDTTYILCGAAATDPGCGSAS